MNAFITLAYMWLKLIYNFSQLCIHNFSQPMVHVSEGYAYMNVDAVNVSQGLRVWFNERNRTAYLNLDFERLSIQTIQGRAVIAIPLRHGVAARRDMASVRSSGIVRPDKKLLHGTPHGNAPTIVAEGKLRVGPRFRRNEPGVYGTSLLRKACEYSGVATLPNGFAFSIVIAYRSVQYKRCRGLIPPQQWVSKNPTACKVRGVLIVPR